jgi:O6-methylguanine-DNA--protein-cysteine methyltransferase
MTTTHATRPRSSFPAAPAATLASLAFDTPLGAMACAWSLGPDGPNLLRLTIGHNTRATAWRSLVAGLAEDGESLDALEEWSEAQLPPAARRLVGKLRRFAEGKRVDFSDVAIAADHLAGFARKVHDECRRVAYGQRLSYAASRGAGGGECDADQPHAACCALPSRDRIGR